jgi:two-component system, cell cycle sensor histidine kinase and response regulator CckA
VSVGTGRLYAGRAMALPATTRTARPDGGAHPKPVTRGTRRSAHPERSRRRSLVPEDRSQTARNLAEAERSRLVEELRASQRDLEEAQRIAHVGSWTLDPRTGEATWSAEMYRILGLDPDGPAIALADISTLFSPESVALVGAAVEHTLATGEPWQVELELATPSGRTGWVASYGVAERDPQSGVITRIRGTMQDVTEQRRLEDELRQAQRLEAVGQLAGGIAHDFNNLLTAIRGYGELLQRSLGSDDPRRGDADQVLSAADRAAALTRQLLAFSRRQVLQPRVVDPAACLDAVAPMLRRLLGESVDLVTHAAPDLGHIKVDPSQLEQVIVNLAVNARDAMAEGGTLTIETVNVELDGDYAAVHQDATAGPHVALIVSDTGSGMDEATRSHIFEPFFTTKEPGKGTGMGLATVYGIVKQSGGSIYLYSEPGHGTSFKIYLPRVDEQPSDDGRARPSAHPTGGSETILVVEDEAAVRTFGTRILTELGYTVLQAADGAEALAIAAAHQGALDLLLTDVIMPGLQGHRLAERLRERRPGLRVLYVSGFTENSVIQHGVVETGIAFLPKPFSGDALGRAVRAALDARG